MSLGKQIIMQAPVGFSRKYVQKRKLNLFFGLKKNKLSEILNSFKFQCLGVYEKKKKRLKHVIKNKKMLNSTTIIF